MANLTNTMSALPVVLPLAAAAIVALTGLFGERLVPHLAVTAGVLNAAFALTTVPRLGSGVSFRCSWLPGISDFTIVSDGLGGIIAVIASVLGALILVYSLRYMEHEHGKTRYYALVLLFIGAMSGLVLSGSLLSLYFFWETVGICSFSLIGFHYEDPKALKGAIKAFITTRIGDVGLIVGILTLYFSTSPHTFDISTILEHAGSIAPGALALAAYAMLLGAMGKSAQVPLHVWLPDAMEAPTSVSALIHAATMVNAGVYLVARMYPAFSRVPGWTSTVTWVGVFTLLAAAFMGLAAKDLKRMLAYSTVSQLGYMFFAVGTGGILASQFHLASHAIFKALLFLSAGAVIHEAGTRNMDDLSGARKRMPVTATAFLLGVMGLSGVPPFNGFFSKDMVFAAAIEGRAYVPLALAVLGAVLTFIYSWRAYFKVFEGEVSASLRHAHEVQPAMKWPLLVLAAGTVTSWLLIGVQSRTLPSPEPVGFAEGAQHAVTPLELVRETLTGPGFLLSLVIMACGYLLVRNYDRVFSQMPHLARSFLDWAFHGFYFDLFYQNLLTVAGRAGSTAAASLDAAIVLAARGLQKAVSAGTSFTSAIDHKLIEGFGRLLGKLAFAASRLATFADRSLIEGSGQLLWKTAQQSGKTTTEIDEGGLNARVIALVVGLSVVVLIVAVETGVRM